MIAVAKHIPEMRRANKAEVAEFFGVMLNTVDIWIRKGCPMVQKGSRGVPFVFDLLSVAQWRFVGPSPERSDFDPDDLSPKERLDWYKGDREKTKHLEEQGALIPAAEVETETARVFKAIAQAIETFPDVAERELGANASEIARLVDLGDRLREHLYGAAIE